MNETFILFYYSPEASYELLAYAPPKLANNITPITINIKEHILNLNHNFGDLQSNRIPFDDDDSFRCLHSNFLFI